MCSFELCDVCAAGIYLNQHIEVVESSKPEVQSGCKLRSESGADWFRAREDSHPTSLSRLHPGLQDVVDSYC